MKKIALHKIILVLLLLVAAMQVHAQRDIFRGIGNRARGIGGGGQGGSGRDSVVPRNKFEDSITLTIYYFDSSRGYKFDSSINDFTRRYPIPATHIYLGNTGAATRSILFAPQPKAGWDPGFHAFDVYKWKLENVRFFNTTRPYTELGYMLGAGAEQLIEVMHTQNRTPNWNFNLHYRLINSPGLFRNQKTNHNNYLFTNWYQGKKRRYNNYLVLLGNRLQATENGGLKNTADLDDPDFAKYRFSIPTNIGGDPVQGTDFFSTTLTTGNRYREFNFIMRQQYDLGRKDSIVTDSTVIPLFFPRLRFEHTFRRGTYKYLFQDVPNTGVSVSNFPDSIWYRNNYDIDFHPGDSVFFNDSWKETSNDFSIYQFPDEKNLHQFIKLGAELQLLKGTFRTEVPKSAASLYNVILHGEYRNLTKNKKWDLQAFGRLWSAGYNLGNYHAYVSLQRLLGSRFGSFQVGFENINRSPTFNYDDRSAFYWDTPTSFNNENTTHLFASVYLQKLKLLLRGDYYLVGNYIYLKNYHERQQFNSIFNVLRVNAYKTFRIGRRWNWHAEVYVQQKAGNAEVNLPVLYTRNRFGYEGNLNSRKRPAGFRNLNIAFGLEGRYHTPYKADNYSPVLGQFFYQDSVTISNLPDVHAFLHFRIRSFTAYFRAENLNTARLFGGFQFNNNNLAAPGYPTPGLNIRLGIFWSFVN